MLYALALILIWVGGLKFAAYEAQALQPLVAESPLLSWLYDIFDVRTFARILGFPQLSPMPGQFMPKDLLLLAAAIWVVGDSLAATNRHRHAPDGAEATAG